MTGYRNLVNAMQTLSSVGRGSSIVRNGSFRNRRWLDRTNPRAPTQRARFAFFVAVALTVRAALPSPGLVASQSFTEYQAKAAILINFLKFVEWPDEGSVDPHGKWTIGIVGNSPVGPQLIWVVGGKNVLGRELVVKNFQPTDDMRSCNILYISPSEKKRVPSILATLRGSSVLTVADMDDFVGSGGMIQFVLEADHIRFAIDMEATGHARLKVSSKLLALARVVTRPERGAMN